MPEIIDCVQGEHAWFTARLGIPTASCFSQVLAKGEGLTRRTYMRRLAGEVITGCPAETFRSPDMLRGNAMEDEARDAYAFLHDADPQRVGFIRAERYGCSPDSLLGAAGMLELKTQKPELLVGTIEGDKFPAEHKPQCQGNLMIAEREWIDISVYWPGMPLFVKRAYRDEIYIRTLRAELERFCDELHEMVNRVMAYGQSRAA